MLFLLLTPYSLRATHADASVLSEYLARNHAALAPLLPGDTVPAVQKEMGGAPRGLTRVGACFGEVIAGACRLHTSGRLLGSGYLPYRFGRARGPTGGA